MRPVQSAFLLILLIGAFNFTAPAMAQQGQQSAKDRKLDLSFFAAPVYQFDSDLNTGGSFSVSRYFFEIDATKSITDELTLGLGLIYDLENYNFSGAKAFGGESPWDKVQRIGLSLPLSYGIAKDWRLSISPSFEFAGETGADWGKAFTYGGVISAAHRFSSDLTLGLGAGVFDRIEQVRAFPFIVIYWRITEHVRLQNPFRVGPAGPAGLEVVWAPGDIWEFSVGGAYRSYRFRLDETGAVPDGIGEVKLLPIFARVSRKLGSHFKLDLYAGAAFAGDLEVEDSDVNNLTSDQYDPAPFLAITISGSTRAASGY